jgi:ribonucleoside-diphosphate reductase alpha chain
MAETPAYMSQLHPDYGRLAARVAMTWMRKSTPETFSACVDLLANNVCQETGGRAALVSDHFAHFCRSHSAALDAMVV